MSVFPPEQCAGCANLDASLDPVEAADKPGALSDWYTFRCLAFPDGIPDDILDGEFDHTDPHEGDGGIMYEPRT